MPDYSTRLKANEPIIKNDRNRTRVTIKKGVPMWEALFLLDFIACGDFCYFAKHPDHRAIAGGGKLNCARYRLGIDVGASHPVEDFEARIDPRVLICPAPLDFNTEAIHLLALLPQD